MQCLACSHHNPEAQKFCGECGAPLSPSSTAAATAEPSSLARASYTPPHLIRQALASRSALEGERKLVTVLFCDIANSTPLAARVGAEAMHRLLSHFFELALAEVHRYEGTINQFLGDGFMALFGAPVAHEDHARRALLAASAIRERLREPSGENVALRDVRVRMGLNTGMVVVGAIGDNLRMDYTAVGDTTNLAARLQQHAAPGAIRISEATRRAASAYFEFKQLGKQVLKGIATPTPIYDLVGVRPAGTGGPPLEPAGIDSPFIGRDRELAILRASMAELRDGTGAVLILRAEPGVGKSRLIAEARRRNGADRVFWLEGRAVSFGRHLSYWPFIEILKACFEIENTDTEARAWQKLERAAHGLFGARAREIVPYLATVLSLELTGEHAQRVKLLDAQALGRQVFLSMHELFAALAQRQPVLLVMEDWHWVDHSSVVLCEHLLPLAKSHAVTFWFATRAEPGEPAARVRAAVARGSGVPCQEISLAALGDEQSGALVDRLVGRGLPEAVRRQILTKADGNPFFIEEVVRALIADGTLVADQRGGSWRLARPVGALALPDTVQGVIVARIDRLEEGVKTVLKLASVIGRSFFLRVLRAIAEAGDAVDGAVGRLEDADLVRLRQQLPELEYVFKHALVQEAAYGSILGERRRAIHESVGQAIETLFGDRLDEFTALLAYHYALAEDWEKAQEYLFKAGDQAGRMAADAEALEHYRRAEAAYAKVSGRELTAFQRAVLGRKLGQAFYGVGRYEQAVEHFSRALGLLGVRYPQTPGGVSRATLKYLAAHFLRRLVPGLARRARPAMDPSVAREISEICAALARMDYYIDSRRFALDGLIELYVGEGSGDELARVRGLATLGVVLDTFGLSRLARARVAEAAMLVRGHPVAIAGMAFVQGLFHWLAGSLDECGRSFEQATAGYEALGDIRAWANSAGCLFFVLYQRGDFAPAAKLAADIVRVGQDAGDTPAVCFGLQALGLLGLAMGPLDEAVAHLTRFRDLCIEISDVRRQRSAEGFLSKARLRQGRLNEAAASLGAGLALADGKKLRGKWTSEPYSTLAEMRLVEVSRGSSPRREAIRAAGQACDRALRAVPPWRPEAQRMHGTLAWLSGDHATARSRWRTSLETAENLGMPVERARTLLEMGDRMADVALVDEAARVFERTGARVYLAFSLHVRARLERESGADGGERVRRYDQAIVVLDEVKAEYELGVACRHRGQLHGQRGDLDQAREDLARAGRCFAAVGAAAEQVEVEREAIALSATSRASA
jgi:class 3 adenylate cyclase/tetratricopeptide (TPR) repeat protein